MNDTDFKEFLDVFFNFILLGERISIWLHIRRLCPWDQSDGMIMFPSRGWKLFRFFKYMLVLIQDLLHVKMNMKSSGIDGLDGIKLGDNSMMAHFQQLFHVMHDDDRRSTCLESTEGMHVVILLKAHI